MQVQLNGRYRAQDEIDVFAAYFISSLLAHGVNQFTKSIGRDIVGLKRRTANQGGELAATLFYQWMTRDLPQRDQYTFLFKAPQKT